MGGGAGGGDAVADAGSEVRGRAESSDPGSASSGDGGFLMGTTRAHLDDGAALGHHDHAGGRRCDRGVMVVDAQQQCLENTGLGKGALDGEERRSREVKIALSVTMDGSGETVVRQPLGHVRADDPGLLQEGDFFVGEVEVFHRIEDTPSAGDDAVAAALGETPWEQFEDAAAVSGSRCHGSLDHGQLVMVGEHCGRHGPQFRGDGAPSSVGLCVLAW